MNGKCPEHDTYYEWEDHPHGKRRQICRKCEDERYAPLKKWLENAPSYPVPRGWEAE